MHILKALDQEQVDVKNNKRLRQEIAQANKRETKLARQAIRSQTVAAEKSKREAEDSSERHQTARKADKPKDIAFMSGDIFNSP
jgi:uncharacterized protein YdaU (DUF1376 family)